MLELFGRGYVIEHCISSLKLDREKKSFRVYVTDALMAIAENTTHFLGRENIIDYGKSITERWIDIIDFKETAPKEEDNRSAEEITTDIWQRIRGH